MNDTNTVSLTREQLRALAKDALCKDALDAIEDRREELYRCLSICAMVKDSLDKTKDDSVRSMEQFEAMSAALEMLRKVWEGLDWMEISNAAADIEDRRRLGKNADA